MIGADQPDQPDHGPDQISDQISSAADLPLDLDQILARAHANWINRDLWTKGLSLWLDRWTPYYLSPRTLWQANETTLAMAMINLAETEGVTVPRA